MATAVVAAELPLDRRIGPPAGRLILLWAMPTIFSVEAALFFLWPVAQTQPTVMIGAAVAFPLLLLLPAFARLPLMELTGPVEHSTRFWVMLFHVLVFLSPLFYLSVHDHPAPLPLGFVALTFPLCPVLVYPRAFDALLATLLLLWWGLLAMVPEIPATIPLAVIGALTIAAGATHLHFRHMRHQQTSLRLWPTALSALTVFAASLPLALVIWICLPHQVFRATPAAPTPATTPVPRAAPSELQGQLTRLLIETTLILAAAFVLVLLAGHMLRRFRKRPRPLPFKLEGEAIAGEEWETAPRRRRRRRRRGTAVRERIVAAYLDAADRMRDRGWEFPSHRTAREFLGDASVRGFAGRRPLSDLTALFERAEYQRGEFGEEDLERAVAASTTVIRTVTSEGE